MDAAAKARAKAAKASKKDGKMKKDQSGKTEAATPGTTSTAARLTAVASVPRSAKPAGARGVMRNYNPVTDAAPAEPMAVKETHFQFRETLLLRPKTDMIVIHHVGIPDGDTSAAGYPPRPFGQRLGWASVIITSSAKTGPLNGAARWLRSVPTLKGRTTIPSAST